MADTHTDCRSEIGITVGLVDALISICRVLAKRDLDPQAVRDALRDLNSDEDLAFILAMAESARETPQGAEGL